MNLRLLETMLKDGYVVRQKHPQAPLYIYNYSSSTQYERVWNEVTLQCRGLILDEQFNIIARPLTKFFNLEELPTEQIPNEPFEVYEKMDGSLGILYFWNGQPYIATRGSFNSSQSSRANEILHQKYRHVFPKLEMDKTYVFEIIFPQNRIVVDYGDREDLILLAMIETATGRDLPLEDIGFPIVKKYKGIASLSDLKQLEEDNREGFVVKFESGFRLKIKFEEYKRLHYIMANVSNKSIWQHLAEGRSLEEMLHLVPDEFYNWVRTTEKALRAEYKAIEDLCKSEYRTFDTRKAAATYFKTCTYPNILFAMLDNKDYSPTIWRLIRPEFEKPFLKN